MKKSFPGYYIPSGSDFAELWAKCTFILDANVLLNLYRYPQSAREDIFKVLNAVSSRLWIPHQAALEYQENRLSVIAEQTKKFDDVSKILRESLATLEAKLSELQLKKRHSAIEVDEFLRRMRLQVSTFEEELKALEKAQPDLLANDILRDRLDELLAGKVGEPLNLADLKKTYEEGIERYTKSRPPGYQDRQKATKPEKESPSYFIDDIEIKREFGDLIIWRQIIAYASEEKLEYIIFVTDDNKEDWWWIVDSKGKKTIGPRPELVSELKAKANISVFYIYNTERLLNYARQYQSITIEQESINQVEDIRIIAQEYGEASKTTMYLSHSGAVAAVIEWLKDQSPCHTIKPLIEFGPRGVFDIISLDKSSGKLTGFHVKLVPPLVQSILLAVSATEQARERFGESSPFDLVMSVIILEKLNLDWQVPIILAYNEMSKAQRAATIFGYLEKSGSPGGLPYRFVDYRPGPLG